MRPPAAIAVLGLVTLAIGSHAARAAAPNWGDPERLAASGGLGAIGVAGDGEVTALWYDASSCEIVSSYKPPGREHFGSPRRFAPVGSIAPALEVNEAGDAVALWQESGELRGRLRRGGREFGPVEAVGSGVFEQIALGMSESGQAIAAWQTGGGFSAGSITAVTTRGRRFGAPRTVSLGSGERATRPAVAINDDGAAVVAWSDIGESGVRVLAAYRPAGGSFGPPRVVYRPGNHGADGYAAAAAVDRQGVATVAWAGEGMQFASRTDGRFAEPQSLGSGGIATFQPLADGGIALWWQTGFLAGPVRMVKREPGERFGPARELLPGLGVYSPHLVLDGDENAVALWLTAPSEGQRLWAGVHTRFGFPEPPRMLTTNPTQVMGLDANRSGTAAALFVEYGEDFPDVAPACWAGPGPPGPGDAPVSVVVRRADQSAPRLQVSVGNLARRSVRVEGRCDEACRLSATIRLDPAGARATALSPSVRRRRGVTLDRGQTGRVTARLSRRDAARMRRLRTTGRRVRAVLVLRAADASGNVRRIRRRLSVSG